MKKIFAGLFVITFAVAAFLIAGGNDKIPNGWYPAGSNPSAYEMGVDNSSSQSGNACAFIKSKSPKQNEFGTLMQTFSAEDYLGKRLKLSGYVKTENVESWSCIWMRIDDKNNQQVGFDNMMNRPIKGTTEWKEYSIVLDVPANSNTINFGLLLAGNGKIWADNFTLVEVDESVPVTSIKKENKFPTRPINMDFEEK